MAKKDKMEGNKNGYYSYMTLFPRRKFSLGVILCILSLVAAGIIFRQNWMGHHWTTLVLPLGALGTLVSLYPKTEEWEYKPWQAQSQRYERHYRGK